MLGLNTKAKSNITPYLPFHPGAEAELMKGAGRDVAKLFMEVHPWVNWDGMLAECLIGILVAEGEELEKPGTGASNLEEMD
jgi:cytochrome b involved in lipid metabolism